MAYGLCYLYSMKQANPDDDRRTTAIGLARYAYEYIEAARLVDDHIGAQPGYELIAPVPAYYMAGHGIELSLKAYLRHHGATLRDLKNYGHDLHQSYRKAKELGLLQIVRPSVPEEGALELLNGIYKEKEFEYIRTGMKHFPTFALVEQLAMNLHNAIALHVGFPGVFTVAFPAEQ
jgi:hypothetical protein